MFWTRVRLPPGPPKAFLTGMDSKNVFDGPVLEFDRASSRKMDDQVGDDLKSSKTINANDAFFGETRLAA